VCLNFFCTTFSISHRVVNLCIKNIGDNGLFVGKDNRTNHKALNKTPISALNLVKEHINSFPKVESHYCRRDFSKLYLSSDLNKALMYRTYTDHFCKERNISPVSFFIYKQTFNSFDPQLSFFLPKRINVSIVMHITMQLTKQT